MVYVLLVMNFI